jgi:hypothetical protein
MGIQDIHSQAKWYKAMNLFMKNKHITIFNLANEVGISFESCQSILAQDRNMH